MKINLVLREEDKVYLPDSPKDLSGYLSNKFIEETYRSTGKVSKCYLMRKYHISYVEAQLIATTLEMIYKSGKKEELTTSVNISETTARRRFH